MSSSDLTSRGVCLCFIPTDVTVNYLLGQVRAGAQLLELFDSWSGDLSPHDFEQFALPYLVQIATRVKQTLKSEGREVVPFTVFPKGSHYSLELIAKTGVFDLISLDWTIDPAEARTRLSTVSKPITLQGNLEPSALFAPESELRAQARRLVDRFGTQRYVCNLGHGMLPYHDPASVAILVDEIHSYSEQVNIKNGGKAGVTAAAAAVKEGGAGSGGCQHKCGKGAGHKWGGRKLLYAAAGAVVGAAIGAFVCKQWFGGCSGSGKSSGVSGGSGSASAK